MRTLALLIATTTALHAAGGPENALVVVNADSWASMTVANEYAAARGIPSSHILELRDLPDFERMNVEDFREKILRPVLKATDARGLGAQIDYILYSSDFPTAIDVTADMAGKQFPKVITQPASINGLTYFYQFTLAKNPAYLAQNINFYYRQIARTTADDPLSAAEQPRYTAAITALQKVGAAREARRNGGPQPAALPEELAELKTAHETLLAVKATRPKNTEIIYNLACVQAQLAENDAAIATLREAMEHGWWDMRHAQQDADLLSVHERADFKELIARAHAVKFELMPTSAFRAAVGWSPAGHPVPADKGARYLLSTVLAQTSGRGMSVGESVANLRRSAAADGTQPRGTVYFMENGDVRSTVREWGMQRAAEKLRELGIGASVGPGVLPQGKTDVAGACVGASDFDWAKSGSTILPGAICEHFTSFGGALEEGASQTPLTALLRAGAAGASGTVTEPYAVQSKFPSPFIHYHYAQGCSLAESFYQSVAAPYQLLIVGDALCAPWKKRAAVTAEGFRDGVVLKGPVRFEPRTAPAEFATGTLELCLDGRRVLATKAGGVIAFDSAKVADGPHELRLIANATDTAATRISTVARVVFQNGTDTVKTTAPGGEWPWDKPLAITASAPGATAITFRQHGREVARIAAAGGTAMLDPRTFGGGPVGLQPVAVYDGGREVFGEPVALRIVPPAPRTAMALAPGMSLAPGFHVTPSGGVVGIVQRAEGDWLAKAGVGKDGEFAVDGWFSVEAEEVFQFQLHGPAQLRVLVDGLPQDWPRGKEWWFVPVPLAKGLHRLRIEGKADGVPQLDVRFGGSGTLRMNGDRFRHAVAE